MVEPPPHTGSQKRIGGSNLAPPDVDRTERRSPLGDYSPEVPTQPVSETSTVTPSGAVYFTSTFAYR